MGCGLEPPTEGAFAWRPFEGYEGPEPTTCIGYTHRLPEVQEVVAAYPHWDRGALRDHVGGRPSRALLTGVTALHNEARALESFLMRRPPKEPA